MNMFLFININIMIVFAATIAAMMILKCAYLKGATAEGAVERAIDQTEYIVVWEDHYEPGETESSFDDLEAALLFAGRVRDDGGFAIVYDEDGTEINEED